MEKVKLKQDLLNKEIIFSKNILEDLKNFKGMELTKRLCKFKNIIN